MRGIEPQCAIAHWGISRFRVWCCAPARNDAHHNARHINHEKATFACPWPCEPHNGRRVWPSARLRAPRFFFLLLACDPHGLESRSLFLAALLLGLLGLARRLCLGTLGRNGLTL